MKPRPTAWAWEPRAPATIRAPPSHCGRRWARRTVARRRPRSTHLSAASRISDLQVASEQVLPLYEQAKASGPRGRCRRPAPMAPASDRAGQSRAATAPSCPAPRARGSSAACSARYSSSKACGCRWPRSRSIPGIPHVRVLHAHADGLPCAPAPEACGRERCRPRSGCRRRNRRSPLARRWARRATAAPAAADHGQRLDPALFDQRQATCGDRKVMSTSFASTSCNAGGDPR